MGKITGKKLKRFYLIYECVKLKKLPSTKELMEYLEFYGSSVSERTLQRDLHELDVEFGIDAIYNSEKNGYYFDEEELNDASLRVRYLEIAYLAENLTLDTYNKYILYAESKLMKGTSLLPRILDAIDRKKVITFKHENYQTNVISEKQIQPYLIREYQNRWYILGYKLNTNQLRLYGIDRISDLKITETQFDRVDNHNLKSLFDHVIGVAYDTNEIIKLEFKAPLTQKKYLDSMPLHKSQLHLLDQEGEAYYQLEVVHNYELEQKLLMHSPFITVTKPDHFVTYFGRKLEEITNRYKGK